jgi:O-antigen/teichoic acid export membrane protein
VPVFWVHAWSALFVTLTVARTKWLVAEGLQRYEPVLAVVAAVTVLGLNLLLIPRWGPVGAAAAAVVGSCAAVLGTVWLFAPLRPLAILQLKALWPFGRLVRAVNGLGGSVAARSGTPGPG